jgi:putative FmdB family regulatory protein
MPTYEYQCTHCSHELEEFHSINEPPLTRCPKCGTDGLVRMMGTGGGVIFKGSGFYQTDYKKEGRSTNKQGAPRKSEETGADKKSEGSGSEKKSEGSGSDKRSEGSGSEKKSEGSGSEKKSEGPGSEKKSGRSPSGNSGKKET